MIDRINVDDASLLLAMRRLTAGVERAARDASLDTAADVAAATRASVPHRSGRLAGSVRAERVGAGARVTMSTPYAAWIEYGGSRGRPRVPEGRYLGAATEHADQAMADTAERLIATTARAL